MLTIKRPQNISNESEKLPMQLSSTVKLAIHSLDAEGYKINKDEAPNLVKKAYPKSARTKEDESYKELKFINTETIEYAIETNWKSGASAAVAGKINQLMDNKLAKMIMGPEYFSFEPNDGWSQQVVEKGNPLSLKFKFRSFVDDTEKEWVGCSWSYTDLIKLFTILTTPPKKYNLYGATIQKILAVGKGSVKWGAGVKNLTSKDDMYKGPIGTVRAAIDYLGAPLFNPVARGQYTLDVEIGKFKMPANIDWILKSFTATPSQQMIMKDNTPMPIWVDFDLELETNEALVNSSIATFFKTTE